MKLDQRLKERLDRLAGPVDQRGVWTSIEKRALTGDTRSAKPRAEKPGAEKPSVASQRSRSGRARLVAYTAVALAVVAGVVVGTTLGIDNGQVVFGTDDGREGHWEKLPLVLSGGEVWSLVMDPDDNMTCYAATRDSIFRSIDGAASWESVLSMGRGFYSLRLIPGSPASLLAIAHPWGSMNSDGQLSPRLMRSDDGGDTWVEITDNLLSAVRREYPGSEPGSVGLVPYDEAEFPGTIILSVQPPSQGLVPFWKSTNGGLTWTKLDEDESEHLLFTQEGYMPVAAELGFTWELLKDASGKVLGSLRCVVVDPVDESLIYAGTTTGVCRSADGGDTWVDVSEGIDHEVDGRLVIDPALPSTLYVESQEGIFKSEDEGATWRQILHPGYLDELGNSVCSFVLSPSRPSTLYAWKSDGLFRSEDGGETWSKRRGEQLPGEGARAFTRSLVAVAPDDPDIVFAEVFTGTGSDLLRSVDGGDSWTTVLKDVWFIGGALLADPNNPSTLYVSKAVEVVGIKGSVAKSVDKGATWRTVLQDDGRLASFGIALGVGDPTPVYVFRSLSPYLATFDDEGGPTEEGVDLADLEVSISRSLDGGASWERVEFVGLPGPIDQLLSDRRSTGMWYALSVAYSAEDGYTDRKVYRSLDGGSTWVTAFDATPPGCGGITIGPGPNGSLYAHGSLGVYRWVPAD